MSSTRPTEEQRLRELFGEAEGVEGAAVEVGRTLLQRRAEAAA